MKNKSFYKIILITVISNLTACSSEPNDYSGMINSYEKKEAEITANNVISLAETFHEKEIPSVTLPNFMSGPIPLHYKKYHQDLGIDVTQLNYTQSEWMRDIAADDARIKEIVAKNPDIADDHHH